MKTTRAADTALFLVPALIPAWKVTQIETSEKKLDVSQTESDTVRSVCILPHHLFPPDVHALVRSP